MSGEYTIFSRRGRPKPDKLVFDELPRELGVQMLWIMRQTLFQLSDTFWGGEEYNVHAQVICDFVCEERGVASFGLGETAESRIEYALTTSDNLQLVLDIMEVTVRRLIPLGDEERNRMRMTVVETISKLNRRLSEHGLGYRFDTSAFMFLRVDSTLTHEAAIEPALDLLTRPEYELAMVEFKEALHDYRQDDFDDCLTKCGSAFESVMKVICDQAGWSYNQNDAANALLNVVVPNCALDAFFIQPLLLIATIRNRLSRSHGQGSIPKNPDRLIAQYAINATASAILLLHEAAQKVFASRVLDA